MIDLSRLPAPHVVEPLDFEDLFRAKKDRLLAAVPEQIRAAVAETVAMESEPLTILLQEAAYGELVLRQRVNDAARATMLAYATGSDLDNRAADYGVTRQVVTPADPDAHPPVEAVMESDDRLRYRCQMAFEGLSVAGPSGAYVFHALSASPEVDDVAVLSPSPGVVRVIVLPTTDARSVPDLLDAVAAYLSDDSRRPLTDCVQVDEAARVEFEIEARLHMYPGPSPIPVIEAARMALDRYLSESRKIGYDVTMSGIYAALHQPGVQRVELASPAGNIVIDEASSALCTRITLDVGGVDV
ncbi:MAG: baseplate J/gp47 family protein [Laribacter sp.]|nr:baseplate J/gp47 family protein [Laribacter sp.]MBP9527822.1 baseplate J/gp47 family protein [Laribacter sp.]MBP9608952.1 baseplate J/gp47 family protein [Laribacter sp.]